MAILTIKQRLQATTVAKEAYKTLKGQAKNSKRFDWSRVPTLTSESFMDLNNLYIDDSTQRDPFSSGRTKKIGNIVKDPDARKFGRVAVTQRDGKFIVVEGQGRCIAAVALNEEKVPVDIHLYHDKIEEATSFLNQSNNTARLEKWEKHHVQLCFPPNSKEARCAKDIQTVLDKTGFEYRPQYIGNFDCTDAYAGIRDSITREAKHKSSKQGLGARTSPITIAIIELMKKYSGGTKCFLRGDLFYPFSAYVCKFTELSKGLERLEEQIEKFKKSRKGSIDIDALRIGMHLGAAKNAKDKIACVKYIKKWK